MADNTQIGITVAEGVASGISLGSGVSVRNLGLLMERERGVPGRATLLTSQDDDRRAFGGINRTMYSPLTVNLLFRNLGGFNVTAYGIRIVGDGTTAARGTVQVPANNVGDDGEGVVGGSSAVTLFEFVAGSYGEEDPGTWGNDLKTILYPVGHPLGQVGKYQYDVYYKNQRVQSFAEKDLAVLQKTVNLRSGYGTIPGQITNVSPSLTAPITTVLSGGTYVAPQQADFTPRYDAVTGAPLGMALFDGVDVQIITCPEMFQPDFHAAALEWVKGHDKFYVYAMPFEAVLSNLQAHANVLQTDERGFCAGYLEWMEVDDTLGGKMWIPPTGFVLGAAYVRLAALNNNAAWTPPAGTDSKCVGAYRFTHPTLTDQYRDIYAKQYGVNTIKFIKGRGYSVWSSRTNSIGELYVSIHISLATNWAKESLLIRTQTFKDKLNTPALRSSIKLDHITFWRNVYDKGGLERSVSFEQACIIVVAQDAENRKAITATEEIIWTETTESIKIQLNRNDGVLVLQG